MRPRNADIDPRHAIEIAPRIWWVGHAQKDDPFQCHAYLLEQGERSVLFDPGSLLTFSETLRKIEEIMPFHQIKYIVCHHQDPDITASLPEIDKLRHPDTVMLTHWRAGMILKHYGVEMVTQHVEEMDWKLELEDRTLRFIFTPYAHFPGAFCTFDEKTRVLFSSDLFGGLTEGFQLYAEDDSYFEGLRPFHEHYMPTREILQHALSEIDKYPVGMIAPQHGSIIPEELVPSIMERLRRLDCGLYLMLSKGRSLQQLLLLNSTLKDITRTMILTRDFKDIAKRLEEVTRNLLPVSELEFFARSGDETPICFSARSGYRGVKAEPASALTRLLGIDHKGWAALDRSEGTSHDVTYRIEPLLDSDDGMCRLVIPLFDPAAGQVKALASLTLDEVDDRSEELDQVVQQLSVPLEVALERELVMREMDQERKRIYERSIRDQLTKLYTRIYMQDATERMFDLQDRGVSGPVGVALLDLDHFKRVNDTFGHNQGDVVLQETSRVLLECSRSSDLPVRLGGEELIVFFAGASINGVATAAERMRGQIEALTFTGPMAGETVTASVGTAVRRDGEALTDLIERADAALYIAKRTGRNRVVSAAP